jgi:DNA mismatch repair protein MutS2
MNERTLRILEFDAIRSCVAECALNEEAGRRIRAEAPGIDAQQVDELKAAVAAITRRMQDGSEEKRDSLPDIGFLLPKIAVEGSVLENDEAFALGLFVERGGVLKNWLLAEGVGKVEGVGKDIPDCSGVAREVFQVLNKDGTLKDLPVFQEINRRIRNLTSEVEAAVARYTGGEEARKVLQSSLPSQRDGRAVLAVKANYRRSIKGIVHEVSATGQTLFIEPEEVVEKNNAILIEKRLLTAEILRVLREMTSRIAVFLPDLERFYESIVTLEMLRAKARYSLETKGVFAKDGVLTLKQARHPLLGSGAVPVDFALDAGKRTVIITGPNTGGKTVTLKTAGLFALMNQFGLAVPAAEGSALPVFDGVFADIGDEQSISQSLSTFSAHMTNIASITDAATDQSLVLLDELGSGTDPAEGSAIAMSLLDYFIEKRLCLIITTHHGVLKNYGYTREGVENASVEFDSRTLSPTYRIVMGIPGESRAIDIASRNGLRPDLIEKARSYLNEGRSDVSALIAGLKQKHRELDEAEAAQRLEEKRLMEERRSADLKELRLRQKEAEIKAGGVGKLKKLLEESRKTLENLVRELKEGEITREKTLKVKEFLRRLETEVIEEEETLDKELAVIQDGQKQAPEENIGIEPGTTVRAAAYKAPLTVVRQDKKDSWIVEIGSLRMSFPESELTPLRAPQKVLKPAITLTDLVPGTAEAHLELNLLGLRLEEALDAMRRQVDAAVLSGLTTFSVVHGKGSGVLQSGVRDFLKNEPRVAEFYFSRPEMGGSGRTEVVLKE